MPRLSETANVVIYKIIGARKGLTPPNDIQDVRREIQDVKFEILKWMLGIAVAQTAVTVTLIAMKWRHRFYF
jgi:hypothetical protein